MLTLKTTDDNVNSSVNNANVQGLLDAGLQMTFMGDIEDFVKQTFAFDEFRIYNGNVRSSIGFDIDALKAENFTNEDRNQYNVLVSKHFMKNAMFLPTIVFAAPIEQVQVKIQDAGHHAGDTLLARMTASIQVVAEQLLMNREIEQIEKSKSDYSNLLQEVTDRVLTGYQVEKVSLVLDTTTQVNIALSPWGKVIGDVQVDIRFSDVDDNMAGELLKKMPQLQTQIRNTVLGASVDATDWAGGVLRQMIRTDVAVALPNFRAAIDLSRQEDRAVVQVVIYPVGKLVQNVHLEIMSDNMKTISICLAPSISL